jgi:cell division initiation protein
MVENWPVAPAGWPLLEERLMRITPLDVRKQEFKRGMRGFDSDEVRAFLTTLADEYEAVLVDNKQLRERVLEQDEKLSEYRNLERTLRDTLMTAEKVTQEARETARKEGEILLQEARNRVQQVLAEGRSQLDELRREALAVHREKETYLGRFRSLAEAQIQFTEQHRTDFKDFDGRLLDHIDAQPERSGPPTKDASTASPMTYGPTPVPSAHLDSANDQWRDYAIEAEKSAAAAAEAKPEVQPEAAPQDASPEVDQVAGLVQDAEQTLKPTVEPVDQTPAAEEAHRS